MRKILGFSLLLISCLAFAVLPVIALLDLTMEEKATWGGAVFLAAEVSWWLAMPLLGAEVLAFYRYWKLKAVGCYRASFWRPTSLKKQESLSED